MPAEPFAQPELTRNITSYAIAESDPFLLAYYTDDGSGLLKPPLHVIRYSRATRNLRRADLGEIKALFQGSIPMYCLGSALSIREYLDVIYIDTHINPSAGCVIVLSSDLSLKAALSGGLVGLMAANYAIIEGSEIHFMSVHPLHVGVFDLKRKQLVEVYPPKNDPLRQQYSHAIEPYISKKWCMEHNAQCDAGNFDVTMNGRAAVNEPAQVFGFEARFDSDGFGEEAPKHVPPQDVVYVFRRRGDAWEHREFHAEQLHQLFGAASVQELVSQKPGAAFERPADGVKSQR